MISEFVRNHPVRAATLAGWIQQAVTGFSAIVVLPILLSSIGAEQTGVWLAFQGFVLLAGLADFGVGLAITRQAAHCLGGQKHQDTRNTDFIPFGSGWDGVRCLSEHAGPVYRITSFVALAIGVALFDLVIRHTRLMDGIEATSARCLW